MRSATSCGEDCRVN